MDYCIDCVASKKKNNLNYLFSALLLASSASLYILIQVREMSITANNGPKIITMITSKPGVYPITPSKEVDLDLLYSLYTQ